MDTYVNVKLLLPPRQSRGVSPLTRARERLDLLMGDAMVSSWIGGVFHLRPVPNLQVLDELVVNALDETLDALSLCFEDVARRQSLIANSWAAWLAIPDKLMDVGGGRAAVQDVALDRGFFVATLNALEEGDRQLATSEAFTRLSCVSGHRAIVNAWFQTLLDQAHRVPQTEKPSSFSANAIEFDDTLVAGLGSNWAIVKQKDFPPVVGKSMPTNESGENSLQTVENAAAEREELRVLAYSDSLTGVLNRRGLEYAFMVATEHLAERELLSLAYLDLAGFKLINDLFGHDVGDQVLPQICTRVSGMLSHHYQFGRVGGDEFVIVFAETPIAVASVMCRGILDAIGARAYNVGENQFYVEGAIGLIEVSEGMKFNDAMSLADRTCRQAKSRNDGGLMVYETHSVASQRHEAELKLIALLTASSATDSLYLEMQPIMSLTAPHASLNFEVLLRMRDRDGQVVRTDHLIAAGEACGRIIMFDRWVLSTTLNWLNTHFTQMQHTKLVCINLSGASLNDEKFLQEVYAMFENNQHIVSHLCLDIAESVALRDVENTRRFVDKVRGYGAKVALDEFGAGYTSFSYLKEFTADMLKIDGSFVANMNNHPANIAIVEAMVNLAKNLGMKVIAEWAEDVATVQTLTEIGVDYVQGFVVARPLHPDKLLSAKSSASLVLDHELAQFVNNLSRMTAPMSAPRPDVSPETDAKIWEDLARLEEAHARRVFQPMVRLPMARPPRLLH